MTNADKLFALFGSMRNLAEAIGYDETGLSRWNKDGERGKKGNIPVRYNMAILDAAQEIGGEEMHKQAHALLSWRCGCCGQLLDKPEASYWMPRRIKT